MLTLDHLAVGCTDLDEGSAWVEERLGVPLQVGGKHARYGTHNRLLGMGEIYFEVIAKDPDAVPEAGHSWFGLDHFAGTPRLANWICQTDDMAADLCIAPLQVGKPRALTRASLSWSLTVPEGGALPFDGAFPTIIEWGVGTVHPSKSLPDSGCRLIRFEVSHPQADKLRGMMDLRDGRVVLSTGPFAMQASFQTPNGVRDL